MAYELKILSAHRSPALLEEFLNSTRIKRVEVFICAAGMAAHLAGAVAARTTRPVIGVPLCSPPLDGLDALYATVQMPPGIPVLTVAAGPAGAKNAALGAVQMLALGDAAVGRKLKSHRARMAKGVEAKNQKLADLGIDEYVRNKNAAK